MMQNSLTMVQEKHKALWAILILVVIFVPFVLLTPPHTFGLLVPKELWISLRIFMQIAWLIPVFLLWKKKNYALHGKYFLIGFALGGGWLILLKSSAIVVQAFGPSELSLINTAARIGSLIFLSITSGLYSQLAKNMRQALLFGFLSFTGQAALFVLVFLNYVFIVVD